MPIHTDVLRLTDAHLAQARRYLLTVECADHSWVARNSDPAFPYLVGTGDSPEAAASDLYQNLAGQIALAAHQGRELPAPLSDYGRPFSVRLPRSLHRALTTRAKAEGVSISQAVVYPLTEALAAAEPPGRGRRQPRRPGLSAGG